MWKNSDFAGNTAFAASLGILTGLASAMVTLTAATAFLAIG